MENKNKEKKRILIIEDVYLHYKIIRELIRFDYEVVPNITTSDGYKSYKPKLIRYLQEERKSFLEEIDNFSNIDAAIIDYELKESSNLNGINFCKETEDIKSGQIPVLFMTILSENKIKNKILHLGLKDELKELNYKFYLKPEEWGKANSKNVGQIISDSSHDYDIINKLLKVLIGTSSKEQSQFDESKRSI